MKTDKAIILLSIFISLTLHGQTSQVQPEGNTILRYGIDAGYFLSTGSGSFTKQPGSTFGLLTGMRIYSEANNAILLGLELNYTRMFGYQTGITHNEWSGEYLYANVYDEKYDLSGIDLGVSLEPCVSLSNNGTAGFYVGASVGLAGLNLETHRMAHTLIDSTKYLKYDEGAYSEYGQFYLPVSFNLGVNYCYKRLMIDVRYKYTGIETQEDFLSSFNNIYLQVGIILF
jgi:hypothetical protein